MEKRYASVEELNKRLGLHYWSNAINSFSDLPDPRGTINGSYAAEFHYDSYEIRLLMAFLNIIDNPMQDIYFTSVINTGIFNVSLDDLSIVNSLKSRDESYYTYVKKLMWAFDYSKNDENENNDIKLHCEDIKNKFIENYKRVYKNDDYNELIIKIKRFLDILNNLI